MPASRKGREPKGPPKLYAIFGPGMIAPMVFHGAYYTADDASGAMREGGASDPRAPDHSRSGLQGRGSFFADHNCYRCKDGLLPCVTKSGACEYPHARND